MDTAITQNEKYLMYKTVNVPPKRVAELMEHPHHPDSFDTEEDNSTKRVNGWFGDFFGQSLN